MSAQYDVQGFIDHFKQRNGYARANQFSVYIDINGTGGEGSVRASDKGSTLGALSKFDPALLAMQAQTVELPSKGLLTKEIFTQNVPTPIGYNIQYSDLTVNFLIDNRTDGQTIWSFFNTWMNMVTNPATAFVGYLKDYACPIYVSTIIPSPGQKLNTGQGAANQKRAVKPIIVKFIDCFPKTLGAVSFDYSSTGEAVKLAVTFAIRKFEDAKWDDWTKTVGASNQVLA